MIRKKLSVKNYQVIVNPRMPGHVIEFSDAHLDINREYFWRVQNCQIVCAISDEFKRTKPAAKKQFHGG